MAEFKGIRLPPCVEPELRNTIEQIIHALKVLQPVFNVVNNRTGDVNMPVTNVTNQEGDTFSSQVIGAFYAEGTLDGTAGTVVITSGGSPATMSVLDLEDDSDTGDDYDVILDSMPEDWGLLAGTRVGVMWTGYNWTIIWHNQPLYVEGILEAALTRGGYEDITRYSPVDNLAYSPTQYVEVSGWFVPTDKQIPSGARVGADWNGQTYRVRVTDQCVEDAPP